MTAARFTFVGDIALGDHPKAVGFGFHSRYRTGIPDALAPRLLPPGPRPDLLIGNLEFPLGPPIGRSASLADRQCRGLTEYASFLALAGVGALNVANNHSSQHGPEVFASTVAALRAAGIHVVGTPDDFGERGCVQLPGVRVALLGWSDRPRQYDGRQPPYNEFSSVAYGQIAAAKARADVVIACIHWGDEFILVPRDQERTIARRMVDAGASVVVGHHPHVVREVERLGPGLVAYSMGNFVGDMVWDVRTRLTGWLTAEVAQAGVRASDFLPGMIADDYLPRPLTEREELQILPRLSAEARAQGRKLHSTDYERVALDERRRHARRTAWMMLRSLARYPSGAGLRLFYHAIRNRLGRPPSAGA
jgi:poly-gamma-glutamate capsule biosynthesis protein CapA/YwtB (metallophosphatase superfamily)